MKPVLELHNIFKQYKIGGQRQRHLNLREELMHIFSRQKSAQFWALDDISFNVNQGESIGIIGSNGAGKSTLLKILSKITPPTKGFIKLRGRVASLLEVGTGFHSELTGRENIYLNGSMLGLRRAEINRKFDQIVDFSGVEKFLDTPLKHYSTGMNLRLAFSVAAHLEPEILLVDEVLAVGDVVFQQKCIEKMEEVRQSGLTILFVSHDLDTVKKLCNRGILLRKGRLKSEGEMSEVIMHYLREFREEVNQNTELLVNHRIFDNYTIESFKIITNKRKTEIELILKGENLKNITSIVIEILSVKNEPLSIIDFKKEWQRASRENNGTCGKIVSSIDLRAYVEGMYQCRLWIEYKDVEWFNSRSFGIELEEINRKTDKYPAKYRGYFEIPSESLVTIF